MERVILRGLAIVLLLLLDVVQGADVVGVGGGGSSDRSSRPRVDTGSVGDKRLWEPGDVKPYYGHRRAGEVNIG